MSPVRCSRKARRLRSADLRGAVLPRAGGTFRAAAEHDTEAAYAPGLPATRVCPLRVLRTRTHRQLVQGPQRLLRVLPLPPWLSRGERHESETRRAVRRRTRAAPANAWLHAPAQGIRAADLEGEEGNRAPGTCEHGTSREGHPRQAGPLGDEAFLFERSIDIEIYDRHAEKLREELTLVRIEATQASSMNSTLRASSRSQNAFCRAPPTCGCRRHSNSGSCSNNCSFQKESRSTERALLEPRVTAPAFSYLRPN